jgi:hypothetical protein
MLILPLNFKFILPEVFVVIEPLYDSFTKVTMALVADHNLNNNLITVA